MIDFHTHILPRMDDGSRSVEESLRMLEMLSEQGIDTVIATPHFYADTESLETFLARREKTYGILKENLTDEHPKVLLGAEVRYYPGISRLEDLTALCLEGTKLLLLEMTETRWTEYTVREVLEIANRGRIKLAIAHVERCLDYQSGNTVERLYQSGILMQFNASFFTRRGTRRRALTMMRDGEIHLLGSDCHNTTSRPPAIADALAAIKKKFGNEFFQRFDERGHTLLEKIKV